jgi:two-component system response regulator FixJ
MTAAVQHIFVVDDKKSVLRALNRILEPLGHLVRCFESSTQCLEAIRGEGCDLLITDVKMPGLDGISLLSQARRMVPWLPVIILTAHADVPMAIRAMKIGAVEFLEKPLEKRGFLKAVKAALERGGHIHPPR